MAVNHLNYRALLCTAIAVAVVGTRLASAAVSADEAGSLKTTLTPLGAEKAGNKDGTIPAWDGGITSAVSGPKVGDVPAALFANEKPVLQISAKNMAQYADKLSDGTQALMKKYPDTFRIDVYPTHRTAAAPAWVYENTLKNASRCELTANGNAIKNCYGGVPFPIPKDGAELIWNHLLRVAPEAAEYGLKCIVGASDGSRTLACRGVNNWNYPYYYKNGTAEKWTGQYYLQRYTNTEPPYKSGETLVSHHRIDPSEPTQSWQYLVGQRRVRRAPTVGYDTPNFISSGVDYFDETDGFMGGTDRYQWKLIGKKEMYIPYNDNGFVTASVDDAFAKHHLNPDKLRWELHRVWVVEATVAPGKRHAVPKRLFYFDEDSWAAVLIDGYDSQGKLWRTLQVAPFVVPTVPAVVTVPAAVFNLQAGTLVGVQFLNGETYRVVARKPDNFYTGEAAAADAAR